MAYADNKPRIVESVGAVFDIALSGTVTKGDLIGLTGATWVAADATATAFPAYFVALDDGVSGDTIKATHEAVISSVSGATVGGSVYMSETAGATTQTAPGEDQIVGVAVAATRILIHPTWVAPAVV